MVSTFTPNINLEEPARGDYVGTWDTPVNNNSVVLDLTIGGIASISLNNSPVILSSPQFQAATLVFGSTLTGSVDITFPSTFIKAYDVLNSCTGSSAFTVTLKTTIAGAQAVCAPPGEMVTVSNLGGNIIFSNLGRIGSYWDHGGSSVPAWVSGCSVPPYLACTGGTFSATTYPVLALILGSTTLPDSRGRARFALDGGATRLTSAVAGFSPNTVSAAGGDQNYQQHTHNITITDPGHFHSGQSLISGLAAGSADPTVGVGIHGVDQRTLANTTGITATSSNSGTGTAGNIPPAYIGGITMIRAGSPCLPPGFAAAPLALSRAKRADHNKRALGMIRDKAQCFQ